MRLCCVGTGIRCWATEPQQKVAGRSQRCRVSAEEAAGDGQGYVISFLVKRALAIG